MNYRDIDDAEGTVSPTTELVSSDRANANFPVEGTAAPHLFMLSMANLKTHLENNLDGASIVNLIEGVDAGDRLSWTYITDKPTIAELRDAQETYDLIDELLDYNDLQNPPTTITPTQATKLSNIESMATQDQTGAEIVGLLGALTGDSRLDASAIKGLPAGTTLRTNQETYDLIKNLLDYDDITNTPTVYFDLHEDIDTRLQSFQDADRLAISDESETGAPNRYAHLGDLAGYTLDLNSRLTTELTTVAGTDTLPIVDQSAAGTPTKYVTVDNLGTTLGGSFDLHEDVTTEKETPENSDRILISDESTSGEPNRYTTFENFKSEAVAGVWGAGTLRYFSGTALPSSTDFPSISLAWDGTNLWGVSNLSNKLIKYDRTTGDATEVGDTDLTELTPRALAWDGTDLWMIGSFRERLTRLDRTTGAGTEVGTVSGFGVGETRPTALAWDGTDLWMVGTQKNRLIRLDRTTGNGTVVGDQGFGAHLSSPRSLAWDGTHLWMAGTTLPRLIRVDRTTGAGRVLGISGFGVGETSPQALAWDGSDLWLVGDTLNQLIMLNRTSGNGYISSAVRYGVNQYGADVLAWDGTDLWLYGGHSMPVRDRSLTKLSYN